MSDFPRLLCGKGENTGGTPIPPGRGMYARLREADLSPDTQSLRFTLLDISIARSSDRLLIGSVFGRRLTYDVDIVDIQ